MRTPETLTDELINDSKRFTRLGIAVLVERKWHFIVSDQTNPLDQLRRLVEVGGKPIGTVGYAFIPLDDETNQKVLTCYSKLFSEWEGDDQMTKYFESLVADMMRDVESRYGKSMLSNANDS
jgi:hypothetical protein